MPESFVDVAGSAFHYRLEGPADAPVLMLSNSLGTDLSMWDAQMPALAPVWRVLRYDSRGHGRSAVTPGPYTIEGLARDALGLLDALGIAKVHFCGLSLGGMVGMWLAVNAVERIDRLALCNTAAQIPPPQLWNTRIEKVAAGGMSAVARAVLERWFLGEFITTHPDQALAVLAVLERTPAAGYVAACAAVRDMDQRDTVGRIDRPTLVVSGTHDLVTPPADGHFLAQAIPGARYRELPAAHLSNIEAAAPFTGTLLDFLRT